MLEELRKINERLIVLYNNDENKLNKQLLIKKILIDNCCFMKIDIEIAYSILLDLNFPRSKIKSIYSELIDISNFV